MNHLQRNLVHETLRSLIRLQSQAQPRLSQRMHPLTQETQHRPGSQAVNEDGI